jgi:hypothetical protein
MKIRRDDGRINPEVMRRIERDLDLEESRIGGCDEHLTIACADVPGAIQP